MARLFDGVDDNVTAAIGGLSTTTLASTWVAVVRRTADGTFQCLVTLTTVGGANWASLMALQASNVAQMTAPGSVGGSQSTFTVLASDGWVLLAASKPSGASAATTYRKYVYSTNTWTHEAPNGSTTDATAPGGGASVRLGSYHDGTLPFNGTMAAAAIFNRVLSQAEIEDLAHSYDAWARANPAAMWVLDQAETTQAVRDWVGTSHQSAITGTSTAAASSPIGYGEPFLTTPPMRSLPASVTTTPVQGVAALPTPSVSIGRTVAPTPVQGSAIIPTPDIFVGSSPPTNVQPGPVVGVASFPAPTITTVRNVSLTPAALLARAIIATPNVSVPINAGDDITGPAQMSLNGFKLGSGTLYPLTEIAGADIDLPSIDNGNVANPSSHGAMPGRKLSQPRVVSANIFVSAEPESIREVMEAFRDNTPLADADEELDLAIQVLDTIYVTRGAVIHRSAPIDHLYHLGYAKAVLQVECTDPRLYSRVLNSATIADGSTVDVFHAGNTTTRPLLRCPGPATGPLLEIARTLADGTEDVRVVEFDLTIADGDVLIIDVVRGTAEISGVSQMRHLTGASVGVPDFAMGRGISEITYETAGGAAPSAVALWRHAYL